MAPEATQKTSSRPRLFLSVGVLPISRSLNGK
jgi:hypothetical protein